MSDRMAARQVRRPTQDQLEKAWGKVSAVLEPTPVVPTDLAPGALLKLETFQPTGAFKVRGALAALAALPDGAEVVTASSGNHGLATAFAAAKTGIAATVVVPANASPAKVSRIKRYPVAVVEHGDGFDAAEAHAMSLPGHYISAYNDPMVIAGHSTLGRELNAQTSGPLTVVVPVGGGGLASGLALWAKQRGDVRIVGVESAHSLAVSTAVRTGTIADLPIGPTIADAIAGNIEAGCLTPHLLTNAEFTSVTDDELQAAMRWLFTEHGLVVEGAGACPIAAVLAGRVQPTGTLIAILTGRNITLPTYLEALS
ncbi:MAG TPA: pyridoxal-phosphate dependent enzyme [Nonomuraea sp.]|nr:pyridoxal-phosphate dependent enzyme [Nonomuraea sp.]